MGRTLVARLARMGAEGVGLLVVLLWTTNALAAYSCSVAVTSISVFFNPSGTTVSTSGSWTISCTKAAGDSASMPWSLSAGDGLHFQNPNRRVQLSGSYYAYNLYTSSPFGGNNRWSTNPPASRVFSGNLGFGAALFATTSGTYYMEIQAPQAAGPAGTYTDSLGALLTYGPSSLTTPASFNVSVNTQPSCTIAAPANLLFNYTSFQGTAATPSVNFTVNCTTGLPYTIALDSVGPITDNAVNLTYTLGLSAASGTGGGIDQIYQVNGSMAAGQSGTCGAAFCTNAAATNKTRTITITY